MAERTISWSSTYNLLRESTIKEDIKCMKWYSSYSQSYKDKIKTTTRKLLQLLSGGDTNTLLNDVLKSIGVSKLYPCNAIIRDLSTATNDWVKHNHKCHYLQFIAPHSSERECKAFGIKCSPTSIGTTRDWYNNIHGVKSTPTITN